MHILVCRRRTGWSSTPGPSSRPCLTCCVSAMAASPLRQAVQATDQGPCAQVIIALQRHNTDNSIQKLPEKELQASDPNSIFMCR